MVFLIRFGASPGTGTIAFNTEATVWQRAYRIWQVAQGFALDLAAYPFAVNGGETTSLALNFSAAPAASSLIYSLHAGHEAVVGAYTIPSGHAVGTRVQQSTNLDSKDSYKMLSGAQNNSWTGLDTAKADAGVIVEVLQRQPRHDT